MGPVIAALIAAAVSLSLARGGTEARLLRRASEALDLAGKVRPRKTRAALHRAAERDIERALKLRQTGRAVWFLGLSFLGSAIVCVVIIPWYVNAVPTAAEGWVGQMWAVIWVAYVVLSLALLAAFARLIVIRGRGLDD